MLREFTCIICPNGCDITVDSENGEIKKISGATCKRGEDYVRQEMLSPMRTIAGSVLVEGGILPQASVRLDRPVPKKCIMDVMHEIHKVRLTAPVKIGDVAIEHVLGTEANIVVTKNVPRA